MTDDELDQALFALPLEEPPAELHRAILAATVLQEAPAFRAWELWLLVGAAFVVGWLAVWMFGSVPDAGARTANAVIGALRAWGLFSLSTYVWLGIGISSLGWISSLNFMPIRRQTVYNR